MWLCFLISFLVHCGPAFRATLLLMVKPAQRCQVVVGLWAQGVDVIYLVRNLWASGIGVVSDVRTSMAIPLQDSKPSLVPTLWKGSVPPATHAATCSPIWRGTGKASEHSPSGISSALVLHNNTARISPLPEA
jgi:hypothetical protein